MAPLVPVPLLPGAVPGGQACPCRDAVLGAVGAACRKQDAGVPPSALEGHPSTLGSRGCPLRCPRWHSAVSLSLPSTDRLAGPGPPPVPPPAHPCSCLRCARVPLPSAAGRVPACAPHPGRWAPSSRPSPLDSVWEGPGGLPGGRVWSSLPGAGVRLGSSFCKMLPKHLALLPFKWDSFCCCDAVWARASQAPCSLGGTALGC